MKENCCRYMLVQMWIIKGAVTCHPLPRVEKLVLVFGEVDEGDRYLSGEKMSSTLKMTVTSDSKTRRKQEVIAGH